MADLGIIAYGSPGPWSQTSGTPAFTNFVLDAATDQLEIILQMPEAATITHLGFRYGARALTPPTYKISLQGVTDGLPDGTIKGGGSPASGTFTPPADTTWNSTWRWIALANSYTCSAGELLCIVIAYDSGTVNGTNNSSFTGRINTFNTHAFPYIYENNAGVRTVRPETPVYGLKSSSKVYGWPLENITATVFNSTSAADEFALHFSEPGGAADTFQIRGIEWFGHFGAAAKTCDLVLYDTDGSTVLQTTTFDTDNDGQVGSSRGRMTFWTGSLATLQCGSIYRISLKPNEATTGCVLMTLDVDTNAELDPLPGGKDWYLNTRVDAGAWTDDSTVNFKRPMMAPILVDLTEPSGSSGPVGRSTILARGTPY